MRAGGWQSPIDEAERCVSACHFSRSEDADLAAKELAEYRLVFQKVYTDPKLTANLYTDQAALPLAEAVAKLPTYDIAQESRSKSTHAHGRSHGHAHAGVSDSLSMSQPVATAYGRDDPETTEKQGFFGVNRCQNRTHRDSQKEWSRGDSNPRAGVDDWEPLRA